MSPQHNFSDARNATIPSENTARHYSVLYSFSLTYTMLSDAQVSKALSDLSKGKDAIFTTKGKRRNCIYHERYPPEGFFKTVI